MTRLTGKSTYGFKPAQPVSPLQTRFNRLQQTPSSINEHLETLRRYAASSDVVCELGVDIGQSTTAFLLGQPSQLFSFDLVQKPELSDLFAIASFMKICPNHVEARIGECFWVFTQQDTAKIAVPACDLLFIDTWHAYPQLSVELALNHERVRKWIILHDVVSFGEHGEGWQDWEPVHHKRLQGLTMAIDEFLVLHPAWTVKERYENNNGLLILGRSS